MESHSQDGWAWNVFDTVVVRRIDPTQHPKRGVSSVRTEGMSMATESPEEARRGHVRAEFWDFGMVFIWV